MSTFTRDKLNEQLLAVEIDEEGLSPRPLPPGEGEGDTEMTTEEITAAGTDGTITPDTGGSKGDLRGQ